MKFIANQWCVALYCLNNDRFQYLSDCEQVIPERFSDYYYYPGAMCIERTPDEEMYCLMVSFTACLTSPIFQQ